MTRLWVPTVCVPLLVGCPDTSSTPRTAAPSVPSTASVAAPAPSTLPTPSTSPPEPALAAPKCAWKPADAPSSPTHWVHAESAGCELAKSSAESFRTVVAVHIVEIDLGGPKALVRVVLLDADGRRVVPEGKAIAYQATFTQKHKGSIVVASSNHKDGVFDIWLPKEKLPKACEAQLAVRFDNGSSKPLEDGMGDWMHGC